VPACPQCGVEVQPDWDWCHSCGFDPAGKLAEPGVAVGAPSRAPAGATEPGMVPPFSLQMRAITKQDAVFDGRTFRVGKKQLVVDQVQWISFFSVSVNGGMATGHTLQLSDGQTTIKFQAERGRDEHGRKFNNNESGALLREFLMRNIAPGLTTRLAQEVLAGRAIVVAGLAIDPQGFGGKSTVLGRKVTFPWSAFRDALLVQGKVKIAVDDQGKTKRPIALDMKEPNAVLLPGLLSRLAALAAMA